MELREEKTGEIADITPISALNKVLPKPRKDAKPDLNPSRLTLSSGVGESVDFVPAYKGPRSQAPGDEVIFEEEEVAIPEDIYDEDLETVVPEVMPKPTVTAKRQLTPAEENTVREINRKARGPEIPEEPLYVDTTPQEEVIPFEAEVDEVLEFLGDGTQKVAKEPDDVENFVEEWTHPQEKPPALVEVPPAVAEVLDQGIHNFYFDWSEQRHTVDPVIEIIDFYDLLKDYRIALEEGEAECVWVPGYGSDLDSLLFPILQNKYADRVYNRVGRLEYISKEGVTVRHVWTSYLIGQRFLVFEMNCSDGEVRPMAALLISPLLLF